jgi:hypothetical protein
MRRQFPGLIFQIWATDWSDHFFLPIFHENPIQIGPSIGHESKEQAGMVGPRNGITNQCSIRNDRFTSLQRVKFIHNLEFD